MPVPLLDTPLAPTRALLGNASHIIVVAGAGMSVDIGTPAYWTGDDATYGDTISRHGHTNLEHSSAPLWLDEPNQQADYFRETWAAMLTGSKPDRADDPYFVLKDWLADEGKESFVVTSNVDTAFASHGYSAERLYEIHGAYDRSQCILNPGRHGVFPTVDPALDRTYCPVCGIVARPNVLFFEDYDFNQLVNDVQREAFLVWQDGMDPARTVVIEIGAGLTVMNLRNITRQLHSQGRLAVVRINPVHVRRGDHLSSPGAPVFEHQLSGIDGLKLLLRP